MASNVRLKSRSDRTVQSLARDSDIQHFPARRKRAAASSAPTFALGADEAEAVRRRIEHLECVIAVAPAEQLARRIAMRDVVPPSDEHTARRRASAKPKRLPKQVQRRARQRSMGLLVQSLVLAVVIAGVVGWLNQCFHFLGH